MAALSSQREAMALSRSSRDSISAQILLALDKPVYYCVDAFLAGTIPRVHFCWIMGM
jgi:hypothetical protein